MAVEQRKEVLLSRTCDGTRTRTAEPEETGGLFKDEGLTIFYDTLRLFMVLTTLSNIRISQIEVS